MQYYQTVSSQIERMNGDFTLSAKNQCQCVIIDQIFSNAHAD